MRYVTLKYGEDSEGMLGLNVVGMPMISYPMAAGEGLLIAHDILEHQNGISSIGSIGDELEALGGVWYIRGEFNDLRRDNRGSMYSPIENLASDIANMAVMYNRGVPMRVKVPNTREHEQDYDFKEMIKIAKRTATQEIKGMDDKIDYKLYVEYFESALHLLRMGYMKAKRRFKSQTKANIMFWNIAEAVDEILKYAEYDGQEFRLGYDGNNVVYNEIYEWVA